MDHNFRVALRLTLFFAVPLAVAMGSARADDADAAFITAHSTFGRAKAGDDAAAEQASELFGKLVEQHPANPLYLAYCGSSWTLRARAAWAPWNKMKLVERGLDMIDRALSMLTPEHDRALVRGVPLCVETRLVAASSYLALPDLFHRFEDGKTVVAAALASPAVVETPPPVRAALEFQASLVARHEKRTADEVQALKRVLALEPAGPSAEQAKARQKEVGQ